MQQFITPNGNALRLVTRGDTNDAAMANAILSEDEYQLKGRRLSGWALDIGAHIGTVGIALAMDNPELSVVCVEPVPENAAMIRDSVAANRLVDRVWVEEAAFGKGNTVKVQYAYTAADNPDKGYIHQSRFIGGVFRSKEHPEGTTDVVRTTTIGKLAVKFGTSAFALLKIDCEGCEVHAFADGVDLIDEIIGEFHDNLLPQLRTLIEPTHDIEVIEDRGGIGLFRAVRR
jgi:FkbM family methyltransferase